MCRWEPTEFSRCLSILDNGEAKASLRETHNTNCLVKLMSPTQEKPSTLEREAKQQCIIPWLQPQRITFKVSQSRDIGDSNKKKTRVLSHQAQDKDKMYGSTQVSGP